RGDARAGSSPARGAPGGGRPGGGAGGEARRPGLRLRRRPLLARVRAAGARHVHAAPDRRRGRPSADRQRRPADDAVRVGGRPPSPPPVPAGPGRPPGPPAGRPPRAGARRAPRAVGPRARLVSSGSDPGRDPRARRGWVRPLPEPPPDGAFAPPPDEARLAP